MQSGRPAGGRAASLTAAVQSATDMQIINEGSEPWPRRRGKVSSKPCANSESASTFIEYGESVSPCSSSAPPRGCADVRRRRRIQGAPPASRRGTPAALKRLCSKASSSHFQAATAPSSSANSRRSSCR